MVKVALYCETMAEIKVTCPECGKQVSLRGLNGHLRFEHDYPLGQARRVAAGIHVDGTLNKLEQEVIDLVRRLYELKQDAEKLRQAHAEGLIGEQLCERLVSQKGQEMTAVGRYLQRLEQSWAERIEQVTGIRPPIDLKDGVTIADLLAKGRRNPG